MRIPMSCSRCSHDKQKAQAEARDAALAAGTPPPVVDNMEDSRDWYLADIEDDNAYVGTCRHGHRMATTIQNVRFELLFESGIVATLVGFHRESVSSIAAAQERFFEFAIEVMSLHAGVNESGPFDESWKLVQAQSERQLGAFFFLWLVTFGAPFLQGKAADAFQKQASFRNGVIHQGKFPTHERVVDYARYVFTLIRTARAKLQAHATDACRKVEFRYQREAYAAVAAKLGPPEPDAEGRYSSGGTSWLAMMLSPLNGADASGFDDRLKQTKANLWMWGFPQHG